MADEEFTLSQIQEKLDVPQHVLIHLCEKEVILPDFAQTEGRGQWRKFSKRNLFEFGVALSLREYEIPVAMVRVILQILRRFEKRMAKHLEGGSFPAQLTEKGIRVQLFFYDGKWIYFGLLKRGSSHPDFQVGFDIKKYIKGGGTQGSFETTKEPPESHESYLMLDLSQIAQRLTK